jgi:hypothetical protein
MHKSFILWVGISIFIGTAGIGSAEARNFAIVAGGGCESDPVSTFWAFGGYLDALRAGGWEVSTLFGQNGFPSDKASKPFTQTTFMNQLQQTATAAQPGDQVMILFDTHGSEGPHGICMGSTYVSPETFLKNIQGWTAKGVRVAVIDGSCYSGGTLTALKTSGACIITSSTDWLTTKGAEVNVGFLELGKKVPSQDITATDALLYAMAKETLNWPMSSECPNVYAKFGNLSRNMMLIRRSAICACERAIEADDSRITLDQTVSTLNGLADLLSSQIDSLDADANSPELRPILELAGFEDGLKAELTKAKDQIAEFTAKAQEFKPLMPELDKACGNYEPRPDGPNQVFQKLQDLRYRIDESLKPFKSVLCLQEKRAIAARSGQPTACDNFILPKPTR